MTPPAPVAADLNNASTDGAHVRGLHVNRVRKFLWTVESGTALVTYVVGPEMSAPHSRPIYMAREL